MPKIRRDNIPPALLKHLLDRMRQRRIDADQIVLLAAWLETNPEVPTGKWFKRFPRMVICGEAELIKTLLLPTQSPDGREVV